MLRRSQPPDAIPFLEAATQGFEALNPRQYYANSLSAGLRAQVPVRRDGRADAADLAKIEQLAAQAPVACRQDGNLTGEAQVVQALSQCYDSLGDHGRALYLLAESLPRLANGIQPAHLLHLMDFQTRL